MGGDESLTADTNDHFKQANGPIPVVGWLSLISLSLRNVIRMYPYSQEKDGKRCWEFPDPTPWKPVKQLVPDNLLDGNPVSFLDTISSFVLYRGFLISPL